MKPFGTQLVMPCNISLLLFPLTLIGFLSDVAALPTQSLTKRTYSVERAPTDPNSGSGFYTWPYRDLKARGNLAPIWYCFSDSQSAQALGAIVQQAVTRWRPALSPNSALTIELHPDCRGNVMCNQAALREVGDTLIISDQQKPDGNPRTAVDGYDYKSDTPGRHTLKFAGVGESSLHSHDELVRSMTHELGHVIGLAHEHQRPDRDHYIDVDLSALGQAYYDVKKKVETAKDNAFAGIKDGHARIDLVAESPQLAEKYGFEEALDFMRGDLLGEEYRGYQNPGPFDYNSIMIYGSWHGTTPSASTESSAHTSAHTSEDEGAPADKPKSLPLRTAVMKRIDGDEDRPIYQGGSQDPAHAGPSAGDIERVKYLYPRRPAALSSTKDASLPTKGGSSSGKRPPSPGAEVSPTKKAGFQSIKGASSSKSGASPPGKGAQSSSKGKSSSKNLALRPGAESSSFRKGQ